VIQKAARTDLNSLLSDEMKLGERIFFILFWHKTNLTYLPLPSQFWDEQAYQGVPRYHRRRGVRRYSQGKGLLCQKWTQEHRLHPLFVVFCCVFYFVFVFVSMPGRNRRTDGTEFQLATVETCECIRHLRAGRANPNVHWKIGVLTKWGCLLLSTKYGR